MDLFQGTSKWSANFQLTKVKVAERQRPKKCRISSVHVYLQTAGPAGRRRLQTRSNPLLGLIYCRRLTRLATGRTAAYHVGTRRRHTFLFAYFLWTPSESANPSIGVLLGVLGGAAAPPSCWRSRKFLGCRKF